MCVCTQLAQKDCVAWELEIGEGEQLRRRARCVLIMPCRDVCAALRVAGLANKIDPAIFLAFAALHTVAHKWGNTHTQTVSRWPIHTCQPMRQSEQSVFCGLFFSVHVYGNVLVGATLKEVPV